MSRQTVAKFESSCWSPHIIATWLIKLWRSFICTWIMAKLSFKKKLQTLMSNQLMLDLIVFLCMCGYQVGKLAFKIICRQLCACTFVLMHCQCTRLCKFAELWRPCETFCWARCAWKVGRRAFDDIYLHIIISDDIFEHLIIFAYRKCD